MMASVQSSLTSSATASPVRVMGQGDPVAMQAAHIKAQVSALGLQLNDLHRRTEGEGLMPPLQSRPYHAVNGAASAVQTHSSYSATATSSLIR